MAAIVVSVAANAAHGFSKSPLENIALVEGHGVLGDAHSGPTVKHRSRVARDPTQPNLRQVHLLHAELLDEFAQKGFVLAPGDMGENITTRGIDLLGLAEGALLHIGSEAVLRVTGLRNPCHQIDDFRPGLLAETLEKRADGSLLRKAGIMSVVVRSGTVAAGDTVAVVSPPGAPRPLAPV